MNSPPMASVAAADRVINRVPESRLGLGGRRLGGKEALRRTSRWSLPWLLTTFQSWFRVSGWSRFRPYNVSGSFRVFQDVSQRLRVGG